jgi:hypothetical protein
VGQEQDPLFGCGLEASDVVGEMQRVTRGGSMVERLNHDRIGSTVKHTVEPLGLLAMRFGLRDPGAEPNLSLYIVERAGPIELASSRRLPAGTEQQQDRSRKEEAHVGRSEQ